MLLTKSIKLVMLISVQGSLAGGADPGAAGPAAGTFLPDRPRPQGAGGTGGVRRAGPGPGEVPAGRFCPWCRGRGDTRRSTAAEGKLRHAGGGRWVAGWDQCRQRDGLAWVVWGFLRVRIFTSAGRPLPLTASPFPTPLRVQHCP